MIFSWQVIPVLLLGNVHSCLASWIKNVKYWSCCIRWSKDVPMRQVILCCVWSGSLYAFVPFIAAREDCFIERFVFLGQKICSLGIGWP